MSSINNPFDTQPTGAMRPEHHLHKSSEPLPGSAAGGPTVDYSPENLTGPGMDQPQPGGRQSEGFGSFAPESRTLGQDEGTQAGIGSQTGYNTAPRDAAATSGTGTGTVNFSTHRPLGVQPVRQGGVAIGGRENDEMPMGKAGLGDKMIGKAQKVIGKTMNDPEMHERGELREAGGKSAAMGSARAPHD